MVRVPGTRAYPQRLLDGLEAPGIEPEGPTDQSVPARLGASSPHLHEDVDNRHLTRAVPVRGADGTAETWEWDGSTWVRLNLRGSLDGRGRLETSTLGVVVFLGDRSTNGIPNVWRLESVGADGSWGWNAGGTPVTLRSPFVLDSNAVLSGQGLRLASTALPTGGDEGSAMEVALRALPQPTNGYQHLRVAFVVAAEVTALQTGTNVCRCWIFEVLRTSLPDCPGLESVQQEAVVLVDIQSGQLLRTITNPIPPGVTFGSCG